MLAKQGSESVWTQRCSLVRWGSSFRMEASGLSRQTVRLGGWPSHSRSSCPFFHIDRHGAVRTAWEADWQYQTVGGSTPWVTQILQSARLRPRGPSGSEQSISSRSLNNTYQWTGTNRPQCANQIWDGEGGTRNLESSWRYEGLVTASVLGLDPTPIVWIVR